MIDPDMIEKDRRRNPYPQYDRKTGVTVWRWRNEKGEPHPKVYPDQLAALHDLLHYIKYLNQGPTLWQQLWWPVRYGLWPALMKKVRAR